MEGGVGGGFALLLASLKMPASTAKRSAPSGLRQGCRGCREQVQGGERCFEVPKSTCSVDGLTQGLCFWM